MAGDGDPYQMGRGTSPSPIGFECPWGGPGLNPFLGLVSEVHAPHKESSFQAP